jgi:hypothetical protein
MRAAAVLSATVIVLGLYLALAAGLAMSAGWIGIGMLAIAVTGAIAVTLASVPASSARGTARA